MSKAEVNSYSSRGYYSNKYSICAVVSTHVSSDDVQNEISVHTTPYNIIYVSPEAIESSKDHLAHNFDFWSQLVGDPKGFP